MQPKVFQLSYGVQGLDPVALDTLTLKMARYPPRSGFIDKNTIAPEMCGTIGISGLGPNSYAIGHGVASDSTRMSVAGPATTAASTVHANYSTSNHVHAAHRAAQERTRSGSVAATNEHMASLKACEGIASSAISAGRAGVLIKQQHRTEMVTPVEFVPFMHHRQSAGSESGDGERLEERDESRGLIDFSDIVPDTKVACVSRAVFSLCVQVVVVQTESRGLSPEIYAQYAYCTARVPTSHLMTSRVQELTKLFLPLPGWMLDARADAKQIQRISRHRRFRRAQELAVDAPGLPEEGHPLFSP